jgi:hypothetical protein
LPTMSASAAAAPPTPPRADSTATKAHMPVQPLAQPFDLQTPISKIALQPSIPLPPSTPVDEAPRLWSPQSTSPLKAAPDQVPPTRPSVAPPPYRHAGPVTPLQPEAPPPQRPVAPQAQGAPSSPTGGDVFLDGTRLGHWLASTLAREAGRPPAGGSSFDPRLGISWPGQRQNGG